MFLQFHPGRSTNDEVIFFPSPYVSRAQCQFTNVNGQIYITDKFGSRNGTWLYEGDGENATLIKENPVPVRVGTTVGIGLNPVDWVIDNQYHTEDFYVYNLQILQKHDYVDDELTEGVKHMNIGVGAGSE